jgi:hypothetical protein
MKFFDFEKLEVEKNRGKMPLPQQMPLPPVKNASTFFLPTWFISSFSDIRFLKL